jgi:hypothetical protein
VKVVLRMRPVELGHAELGSHCPITASTWLLVSMASYVVLSSR